jgi:hypothetical protein
MCTGHGSKRLIEHFRHKPWQGNAPMLATFLFVGLDANYNADIEEMLPKIFDYLDDGVNWWQTNVAGVHHPFRLPEYHGDGKRYHNNFAKIGFTPCDAELVSFVELLHVPTTGRSALTRGELSDDHLRWLSNIFDNGAAKYIFFVGQRVARLMRERGMFFWLRSRPLGTDGNLKVLRQQDGRTIYEMYHLAAYGWQWATLNAQIAQISQIVQCFRMAEATKKGMIDYWFKVLGMLQQIWAFINVEPDGSSTVFFMSDDSTIFDEMRFTSQQEVCRHLTVKGFSRYAMAAEAQKFLSPPKPPFRKRGTSV